jgi:hypothetical protein
MTARAEQLEFVTESNKEYAARMLPRLIPIARMLAALAHDHRVSAADVRRVAEDWHILTGEERGRRLSFIHEVFPKSGLLATDVYERSDHPKAGRNLNRVWYLPSPEEHV